MDENRSQKDLIPVLDLEPDELQSILDTIDDSLVFWQVLYQEPVSIQPNDISVQLDPARDISDWLKMSSAPLYASQGVRGAHGLAYRLLNLALKIFGRPQVAFNQRLRDFMGELMLSLQGFNDQAKTLQAGAAAQQQRILRLEQENADLREEIAWLAEQVAALRSDLDQVMDSSGRKGPA